MLSTSVLRARGQADVGNALIMREEGALLDRTPVNSRLCAVQLDGSVLVDSNRLQHGCLFVVSVYTTTEFSSSEV